MYLLQKMRQHEANSQNLKTCEFRGKKDIKPWIDIAIIVRFSLKDLEKEYEKTEDDIKAVQSVGQIIAEVLKQLDDERCELVKLLLVATVDLFGSYCQGVFWSPLCRLVSTCSTCF